LAVSKINNGVWQTDRHRTRELLHYTGIKLVVVFPLLKRKYILLNKPFRIKHSKFLQLNL